MKFLALYLPQYHEVKENNEWWGEGYTEWSAVKSAVPYFKVHHQPKVPLNNNYYNLADESAETWKWQAELAKKYGVYGFAIYHYWFKTGKQLLEKPMEILLRHKEIDIKYCIAWANETWTRTWYGLEKETLMLQEYGEEKEWKNHFNYLLQFFKDERYIKVDNKPLINIYHTKEIFDLKEMIQLWNKLAVENGFAGVYIVSGHTNSVIDDREELFDAYYNFEPAYTLSHKLNIVEKLSIKMSIFFRTLRNKIFKNKVVERCINGKKFVCSMQKIVHPRNIPVFPGAFPQWDNTPRRKYKGTIFMGMDEKLFKQQINDIKKNYKETEFVYINAWNEWGEGAYLEPEEKTRYNYLEVILDANKCK